MKIYRVNLIPNPQIWQGFPRVELFFTKRPSNEDIISRLKAKIDPEVVDKEGSPWIDWFLDMVKDYPIQDGKSYFAWRDPITPGEGIPVTNGSTTLFPQTVIELAEEWAPAIGVDEIIEKLHALEAQVEKLSGVENIRGLSILYEMIWDLRKAIRGSEENTE